MTKNKKDVYNKNSNVYIVAFTILCVICTIITACCLWQVAENALGKKNFIIIVVAQLFIIVLTFFCIVATRNRRISMGNLSHNLLLICVSIGIVLSCGGAVISVATQIYQYILFRNMAGRIDYLDDHLNDLYFGMLITDAEIIYETPGIRHKAICRYLQGLKCAVKVNPYQSYYGNVVENLTKYIDVISDSAFIYHDRSLDEYRYDVLNRFAEIGKANPDCPIENELKWGEEYFKKKIESIQDSIEMRKNLISSNAIIK